MRKFYSIILTALLTLVSVSVNAVNITVNVDDPSRVSIYTNYGSTLLDNIVAGDNQLTVNEYESMYIKANGNAFITNVMKNLGGVESETYVSNMTECSIYVNSSDEGAIYTVTSVNADEARDGSCTIWVDNPANVLIQRSGTYSNINLVEGDNEVKFIKDKELPLTIGPKDYETVLYQVKVNNDVVAPQGTVWRISPANGDKVEVFANFPDVEIPVEFKYSSDEAKGFVTGVTVNGEAVTNYNDADFTVKAGNKMVINGNTTDYSLTSFKVNGNPISFYGQYTITVTEKTTIEIDAHKYGTVKATIDIDNPDNVVVYKGYEYNNNVISGLTAGENEIELSETNTMIQIKAASGCFITSVTAGEMNISKDYSNAYNVTVTEGMKIVVRSGAIERNSKAVVYIDSKEAAAQYFNFQRGDRSSIEIVTGYNEINFYEGDNPFGLSWYGAEYANVYKNNETVEPMYPGSTTYELNLADGDIVKIFLASNPETFDAELTADTDVDAGKVAVTMDRIRNVADWTGKHSVLQGTEICIKPADGYSICVKKDGEDIVASEDGTFTVTVDGNTTVAVSIPEASGIKDINTVGRESSEVYNIHGMRVMRNADIKQLPAGIYIINGNKVIKR